jgi:tetratricopeptide (TPR) repeat protein
MGKKSHIKKRVLLPTGGGSSSSAAAARPASSSASSAASTAAPAPSAGGSVDELVAAAEAAVDQLDLETAAELYEAALERCPDEPRLLDALGEVCFQTGDAERAGELFTQSVALQPGGPNFTRYMYLAQLAEGPEAVTHYTAGVACLRTLLAEAEAAAAAEGALASSSSSSAAATPDSAVAAAGAPPAPPSAADRSSLLRRELSKALCGLAELYMTDLCDDDGAEAACEGYAVAAVAADGACAEAHRVLADLRLCQKRPSDSVPLITRSVALMEACYPADEQELPEEGEGDDDDMDGGGAGASSSSALSSSSSAAAAAAGVDGAVPALLRGDPLAALPSYDSRLRAAQIALEVEAYAPAVTVLERLLAEDDSDMQVRERERGG